MGACPYDHRAAALALSSLHLVFPHLGRPNGPLAVSVMLLDVGKESTDRKGSFIVRQRPGHSGPILTKVG